MQDTKERESDGVSGADAISKGPLHSPESPDISRIQARVRELESENLGLRKILWHMKNRGPVPTGIILSSIGGFSLLISYLWSASILTFIGLGLTLWGVLIMYISSSRHIRAELLHSISSSLQKCVDNLLVTYMGYAGEVIFFHPKSLAGLGQGYVFIPHYTTSTSGNLNSKIDALNLLPYGNEGNIPSVYLDPKGIFLVAPSQGLVDLFEKELGVNFATVDLGYIQQAIPRLLIEELKIVDEISIEQSDTGDIVMRISGGPCTDMCRVVGAETRLGNHLGCPLCSAVALVVSKVKAKPVTIKETKVTDDIHISTSYVVLHQ
jgi:hypothetical protein